jgi:hypothetical protein
MNDEQWSLLVGLPQSVMTAASSAERDSGRRTHAEGEAGLEAISDGRDSGNPLVEAIAIEVIDRHGRVISGGWSRKEAQKSKKINKLGDSAKVLLRGFYRDDDGVFRLITASAAN